MKNEENAILQNCYEINAHLNFLLLRTTKFHHIATPERSKLSPLIAIGKHKRILNTRLKFTNYQTNKKQERELRRLSDHVATRINFVSSTTIRVNHNKRAKGKWQ
jgi:hypothetical protein